MLHRVLLSHRAGNIADHDALKLCKALVAARPELPAIKAASGKPLETYLGRGAGAKQLRAFLVSTVSASFLQRYQLSKPAVVRVGDRSVTVMGSDTVNDEAVALKFFSDFPRWKRELQTAKARRGGSTSTADTAAADKRVLPAIDCALADTARSLCHDERDANGDDDDDDEYGGAGNGHPFAFALLQRIEGASTLDELREVSTSITAAKQNGDMSETALEILRAAYRARGSVIYSSITEEADDGGGSASGGGAAVGSGGAAGEPQSPSRRTSAAVAAAAEDLLNGARMTQALSLVSGLFNSPVRSASAAFGFDTRATEQDGNDSGEATDGNDAAKGLSAALRNDGGLPEDHKYGPAFDRMLSSKLWYVGALAEERCSELVEAGLQGDFLVRKVDGAAGKFAMVVKDGPMTTQHFIVPADEPRQGFVAAGSGAADPVYPTLDGLVDELVATQGVAVGGLLADPVLATKTLDLCGGLYWDDSIQSAAAAAAGNDGDDDDAAAVLELQLQLSGWAPAVIPTEALLGSTLGSEIRDYLDEYPFVAVLPAYQSSLRDVVLNEHPGRQHGTGPLSARFVAKEVLLGVGSLHDRNVLHTALSPTEILRCAGSADGSPPQYRLSGMSFAVDFDPAAAASPALDGRSLREVSAYIAPELVRRLELNPDVSYLSLTSPEALGLGSLQQLDLWGYAATVYELVSEEPMALCAGRKLTRDGADALMQWRGLSSLQRSNLYTVSSSIDLVDLMDWLTDPIADARPHTAEEVLQHRYFSAGTDGVLRLQQLVEAIQVQIPVVSEEDEEIAAVQDPFFDSVETIEEEEDRLAAEANASASASADAAAAADAATDADAAQTDAGNAGAADAPLLAREASLPPPPPPPSILFLHAGCDAHLAVNIGLEVAPHVRTLDFTSPVVPTGNNTAVEQQVDDHTMLVVFVSAAYLASMVCAYEMKLLAMQDDKEIYVINIDIPLSDWPPPNLNGVECTAITTDQLIRSVNLKEAVQASFRASLPIEMSGSDRRWMAQLQQVQSELGKTSRELGSTADQLAEAHAYLQTRGEEVEEKDAQIERLTASVAIESGRAEDAEEAHAAELAAKDSVTNELQSTRAQLEDVQATKEEGEDAAAAQALAHRTQINTLKEKLVKIATATKAYKLEAETGADDLASLRAEHNKVKAKTKSYQTRLRSAEAAVASGTAAEANVAASAERESELKGELAEKTTALSAAQKFRSKAVAELKAKIAEIAELQAGQAKSAEELEESISLSKRLKLKSKMLTSKLKEKETADATAPPASSASTGATKSSGGAEAAQLRKKVAATERSLKAEKVRAAAEIKKLQAALKDASASASAAAAADDSGTSASKRSTDGPSPNEKRLQRQLATTKSDLKSTRADLRTATTEVAKFKRDAAAAADVPMPEMSGDMSHEDMVKAASSTIKMLTVKVQRLEAQLADAGSSSGGGGGGAVAELQKQIRALKSDLKSCKSSLRSAKAEVDQLTSKDGSDTGGGGSGRSFAVNNSGTGGTSSGGSGRSFAVDSGRKSPSYGKARGDDRDRDRDDDGDGDGDRGGDGDGDGGGYRGSGGGDQGSITAASLSTQRLENEIDRARQEASEWKEKYGALESKLGVLARSHSLLRSKFQARPGAFGTPSPHKMATPSSGGKAKKRGFFSSLKL